MLTYIGVFPGHPKLDLTREAGRSQRWAYVTERNGFRNPVATFDVVLLECGEKTRAPESTWAVPPK